jgi:hypothetical protein
MNGRDRPARHDRRQRLALRCVELRPITRRLATDQPVRAVGVEPQHPVTHGLQANPADASRIGPSPAVVDLRHRQEPPSMSGALGRLRQHPQSRPVKIVPKTNCRSHAESPLLHTRSQSSARLGILRESRRQRELVSDGRCRERFCRFCPQLE